MKRGTAPVLLAQYAASHNRLICDMPTQTDWSPDSWQRKAARQQPNYPDRAALQAAVADLSVLPPLVTSWETEALKSKLADAAQGKRFLLHGGDCAENFDECRPEGITNKLKILLQMSLVLLHGLNKPVIRLGRFAGQYAKPRSSDLETRDGLELPSYRGDLVNGIEFTPEARIPDPQRMLRGYERAALTLNYIRSLIDGGFADLHHPENWDLQFMDMAPMAKVYRRIAEDIAHSLRFTELVVDARMHEISRVDFYTSHEGLLLWYEQAQTRQVPKREGWYNSATHYPWIGARTAELDGAHVEYFRGIRNPVGVKVGPQMAPEEVAELVNILNPDNEPGRLTLIHRFGVKDIEECLPALIEAVRKTGKTVLWCCDPMHGNTQSTSSGLKTRDFDNILSELKQSFSIHRANGSHLGGVHFELTGDNVTECIGGARGLAEADLQRAYKTQVDPRLNYEQALEMAMLIVDMERQALR